MSWNTDLQYDKSIRRLAMPLALALHLFALVCLASGGHGNQLDTAVRPVAVLELVHFDPEGGEPGKSPEPVVPAQQAQAPPPPEIEEEPPKLVESTSEKAAPAPPPPPKKKEIKKVKPAPAPPEPPKEPQEESVQGSGGSSAGGQSSGSGSGKGGYGGGSGSGDADALRVYTRQVQHRLNRYKKYPTTARYERRQGTVTVKFSVAGNGDVFSQLLVKRSGHVELDEEVMALLRRISPLPPIPKTLGKNTLTLTVPITFTLK